MNPTHADLVPDMLLPFLDNGDPQLESWNVGIVEAERGTDSDDPLGAAGTVKMVNRARLADSSSVADIKALMSKRDLLFDCTRPMPNDPGWEALKVGRIEAIGHVPLLLLYPIDRISEPRRASNVRVSLNAALDVIGYGIVFPGSVTEGGNFVSVELRPFSAEEVDEIAAEETAQVEAAGVE